MRSSTVGRSTLSRESMDVIENLAGEEGVNFNNYNDDERDNLPEEYVRQDGSKSGTYENKSKEIDLLWQSLKASQFNTNSPLIYILSGFILGIVSTLVVLAFAGVLSHKSLSVTDGINAGSIDAVEQSLQQDNEVDAADAVIDDTVQSSAKTPLLESNVSETSENNMKKYIIKDGDTVEGIIKKQYGSYTPERAQAIMKANNLKNLDHISIDQVLYLPLEN